MKPRDSSKLGETMSRREIETKNFWKKHHKEMTKKKRRQAEEYNPELFKNGTSKRWLNPKKCRRHFRLADGFSITYYFSLKHFTWNAVVYVPKEYEESNIVITRVARIELKGAIRLYIAEIKNPAIGKVIDRMKGAKDLLYDIETIDGMA